MDDLISRQAAIDALDKRFDSIPMEQTTGILLLRKDLRDLPSEQPQRMRGRWKLLPGRDDEHIRYLHCSVCHFNGDYESNFCPNCGADMRGEDDE